MIKRVLRVLLGRVLLVAAAPPLAVGEKGASERLSGAIRFQTVASRGIRNLTEVIRFYHQLLRNTAAAPAC
jgi:hypothetical protein